MWKIVMKSMGGTKRDFLENFDSESEAYKMCEEFNWVYDDGYVWDLEIEEM